MTEAEKRAKKKYLAKGKRLTVDFYPTEADLIEHIEKQPQKQTYIKDLIRADIKKQGMIFKVKSTCEWYGSSTLKKYPILKDYNPSFDLDNDTLSIEINTLEELWDLLLKLDEDLIISSGIYKNFIEPSIEIYNGYRE